MNFNKKLLVLIFVLSVSYAFSQTKTLILPNPTPPPGNIKLLPGYTHEQKQGIDSSVGEISKKDGLIIRYDIGDMAGNRTMLYLTKDKGKLLWYKTQKINNDDLLIAYFKDGKMMATFQNVYANFFAETKSQEDIVDFLLIVMTYKNESKDKK